MESVAESVQRAPSEEAVDPARRPLIVLSWIASVVITTGTFLYTYPTTLRVVEQVMVALHAYGGDLMTLVGIWYLVHHLSRTWRMWRFKLSRWSGYVAVTAFLISAVSGVYGQVVELPSDTVAWQLHVVSSIVLVVMGCVHGAYGLRRRFS